jgi:hypothetical protein
MALSPSVTDPLDEYNRLTSQVVGEHNVSLFPFQVITGGLPRPVGTNLSRKIPFFGKGGILWKTIAPPQMIA